MSNSKNVYRIIQSIQVNAAVSSTGGVKVYTDEDSLIRDLLPAQLKMDRYAGHPKSVVGRVLLDFWHALLGGDSDSQYPYPFDIRVQKHVTDPETGEGSWVPVRWSYQAPTVTLDGEELR